MPSWSNINTQQAVQRQAMAPRASFRGVRPAGNVTPWTTPSNAADIPSAQTWITQAIGLSDPQYETILDTQPPAAQQNAVFAAWQALSNIYTALRIDPTLDPVYIRVMQAAYGAPGTANVFSPGRTSIPFSPNNGTVAYNADQMFHTAVALFTSPPAETSWQMVIPFQLNTDASVFNASQPNGSGTNFPKVFCASPVADYRCGGTTNPSAIAQAVNPPLVLSMNVAYQVAAALNNTDLGVLVNNAIAANPAADLDSASGRALTPFSATAPTAVSVPPPVTLPPMVTPATPVTTPLQVTLQPAYSPTNCTMPSNTSSAGYGAPGNLDPYFQNEASRDIWIQQHPTCTPPPPLQTALVGTAAPPLVVQPNPAVVPAVTTPPGQGSPTYFPGASLVSSMCQVPLGLPVTQASALAWNQANPNCQPIFAATDAFGNPVFGVTSAPIQNVPQAGIAGIPWWGWALGGVAVVGVIAIVANSTKPRSASRPTTEPGNEPEAEVVG